MRTPRRLFIPGPIVPARVIHPTSRRNIFQRLIRNRYNPRSRWITARDVWLNFKEELHCWLHRVPPGSRIHWRSGDIETTETTRE
jgi:hypothetical protein